MSLIHTNMQLVNECLIIHGDVATFGHGMMSYNLINVFQSKDGMGKVTSRTHFYMEKVPGISR